MPVIFGEKLCGADVDDPRSAAALLDGAAWLGDRRQLAVLEEVVDRLHCLARAGGLVANIGVDTIASVWWAVAACVRPGRSAIPCRAIRAIAFVVDGLRAATALNVLSSTDVRQVQWMKTADEEDCPDKRQGPFHSEKQRITLEAE